MLRRTRACAHIFLLASLTCFTPAFAEEMRLHFIDVGQGNATIVEFPCAAMLIDTGGEMNGDFDSNEALVTYLDDFFKSRPDLNKTFASLILTHAHIDHTRGVKNVLSRYKILNAVTNGHESGSGKFGQIALHKKVVDGEETADPGDDVGYVAAVVTDIPADKGLTGAIIDPVKCANVDPKVTVLWGATPRNADWSASDFRNENNHSVVVRIDFGKSSVLFTGDLEEAAIPGLVAHYRNSGLLSVDVYEVGHHGSHNATTEQLLRAMKPHIAVISMGDSSRQAMWTAWAYGHPRRVTIDLLQRFVKDTAPARNLPVADGAKQFRRAKITRAIYGTGWAGSIVLEADTDGNWKRLDQDRSILIAANGNQNHLININTASANELASLPMISLGRAKAIIDYRTQNGRFASADDLLQVRGIGAGTVSAVRHFVTADGGR
jgi:competence ComEA-like helix-hairpin-helix protein